MPEIDAEGDYLNIVFAIKALGNQGGGAERVLVDVASGLTRRGHTVTLISSDPEGQTTYYPLDETFHGQSRSACINDARL